MDAKDLERFLRGTGIRKVSARDLASAIALRQDGATTVAASLVLASRAGIRTFATGGIGGVHRRLAGLGHATDESADLMELACSGMVVVCAGAKSILDLDATWERLDTLGVPVVGVGTDEFPAFYSRTSGIALTTAVDTASEVADIARAHFGLGRPQSLLVVQAPPADIALDAAVVDKAVAAALEQAGREDIRGAAVTPYLLAAVGRETGGRALQANLGLLESNARLAAEIAVCLAAAE